jgi:hypothetical protein
VHALDTLAEQPKGVLGETKQASSAGAKGVDDDVAIISVEQNDFDYLGMSQMQSAHSRHVRPTVSGVAGVKDGDLDRQELVACKMISGSRTHDVTCNSGRRQSAPTKRWHCM